MKIPLIIITFFVLSLIIILFVLSLIYLFKLMYKKPKTSPMQKMSEVNIIHNRKERQIVISLPFFAKKYSDGKRWPGILRQLIFHFYSGYKVFFSTTDPGYIKTVSTFPDIITHRKQNTLSFTHNDIQGILDELEADHWGFNSDVYLFCCSKETNLETFIDNYYFKLRVNGDGELLEILYTSNVPYEYLINKVINILRENQLSATLIAE